MKTLQYFLFITVMAVFLAWHPNPASAQSADEILFMMQEQLMVTMNKEPPLTEEDIKTYIDHAEAIYRLRYESDKLGSVVIEIDPWTEARFAYVTTKMAVGMFSLMRPDDPRNRQLPEFSKPTPQEMELIKRHQSELTKTMESLQTKYSSGS